MTIITPTTRREDRWRVYATLAVTCTAYLVFCAYFIPRLNNNLMSDREFTGWVGPIAERIRVGERPYIDFVLPIPPGSLAILAVVQRAMGRSLLLQELWLNTLAQLGMGLLGYGITSRLAGRTIGLLTLATTLALLLQQQKECAYDHTSQLCAWASVWWGTCALTDAPRRSRNWFLAGLFATLTLAFKQSTAVGIVGGWALGLGALLLIERLSVPAPRLRARVRDGLLLAAGMLTGLLLCWALLLALGSTLHAFWLAVFSDGPALKGGSGRLLRTLFDFVFSHTAFKTSLLGTVVLVGVGLLAYRRQGNLTGSAAELRNAAVSRRAAVAISATTVLAFGGATALLVSSLKEMPRVLLATADSLNQVPAYGLALGAVFAVGSLVRRRGARPLAGVAYEQSVIVAALFLVVMTCSLIYNTSFVIFRPFYYNNPNIPFALMFLFLAPTLAGQRWLVALAFVLSLGTLYGSKLDRAMTCTYRIGSRTQWAGMRVNFRGTEVIRARQRIRRLAGPAQTVLILPEDVQLAGLVDRPRPPLTGAIVFVDQYAPRLLAKDLQRLHENLPKVIVMHPHRDSEWRRVFATWNDHSAAAAFIDHVRTEVLPQHYQLDSTFRSIYFWDQGQIDVFVRKPTPPPAAPPEEFP